MDSLLLFQILIIAVIIGGVISYSLHLTKNPAITALIIVVLFIIIYGVFDKNYNFPVPTAPIKSNTTSQPTNHHNQIKTPSNSDGTEEDLPFDNLQPDELLRRLNSIYLATAQPAKIPKRYDELTTGDKRLTGDGASLSSNSTLHLNYGDWLYPENTKLQVNSNDCTNYDSGEKSCVQQPNRVNGYPIPDCQRKYNRIPDDYSKQMEKSLNMAEGRQLVESFNSADDGGVVDSSNDGGIIYYNAPKAEKLTNVCRTCSVGICKHDICL
jgi:hypothetical protein